MTRTVRLLVLAILLLAPSVAAAEFNPALYKEISQAELVKDPEAHAFRKYRISDVFNFCGSDFCAQVLKTKIDTRQYYCFNLGVVCMVRMYLKKGHPDAEALQNARKGDTVTVYGTFDYMGSNYHYLVADHVVVGK